MDSIFTKKTRSQRMQPHATIHQTPLAEIAPDEDSQTDEGSMIGNLDYAYDFVGTGLLVIRT